MLSSQRKYLDRYQDWQTFARRYARSIGLARFAAGITADTCSRTILLVEERDPNGDWNETQDARLRGSMTFDSYRSETADAAELVRAQAWHYQVAGEMAQVVSDGQSGVDWGIYSLDTVNFDRPKKGLATIKLVPGGSVRDGTAFIVPRENVHRFWLPDEEYPALATSPMAASISDLHKLWAIGRVIQRTLDSRIAMDGVWWTPSEAHRDAARGVSQARGGPDNAASQLDRDFVEISRRRFEDVDGDDVSSIAPFPMNTPGANNMPEPKWIKVGDALNKDLLEFEAASRMNFARGINLPGSLAAAGGPGDANHWTEWLVDRRFFDSVVAPVMNRITHLDMTRTYLVPVLRMFRLDPNRYRVGYDPGPVIVEGDKSDLAIKLNAQGILSNEATLEACNFDPNQIMGPQELARLLEILARGREYTVANSSGGPLKVSTPPPTSPQGLPSGTPVGPPSGGPPAAGRVAAADSAIESTPTVDVSARATADRVLLRLAQSRRDAGRALRATAEHALEEALRRAGVKVQVRARNRKPLTASARAEIVDAVDAERPLAPLMAAVGLQESEVLGGAFATYQAQAARELRKSVAAQREAIRAAGLDPDDVIDDSGQDVEAAAAYLSAGLLAIARQRLTTGPLDLEGPGEVSGAVPASMMGRALSIAIGRAGMVHGATPDNLPTTHSTGRPDVERLVVDQLVGSGTPVEYEWVHGFYGEPNSPFDPHVDLDGYTTTDTETDPALAIDERGDWLGVDYYRPGDHGGDSCEWVARVGSEAGGADGVSSEVG